MRTYIFHNLTYDLEKYIFSLIDVCYLNQLKEEVNTNEHHENFWKGKYNILKLIADKQDIKKQGTQYILKRLPNNFSFQKTITENNVIYHKYINWFAYKVFYLNDKTSCKKFKQILRIYMLDFIIIHKEFIYSMPIYDMLRKSLQSYLLYLKKRKFENADLYIEQLKIE
uniref:Uncharacterized protein n=1 Tax=viral metagenome TaxID=1070528 RepID=A0A6C0FDM5_9ZZZZ|tara:strand:- start:4668 stop:5174 length:507 start_codon:yes stop_codon:yes gene_type:complete